MTDHVGIDDFDPMLSKELCCSRLAAANTASKTNAQHALTDTGQPEVAVYQGLSFK